MMRHVAGFLALAVSLPPAAVRGDDEPEAPPPTVILIRPAASPVPALKYSAAAGSPRLDSRQRRDLLPSGHRAPDRRPSTRQQLPGGEGQDVAETAHRAMSGSVQAVGSLSRWQRFPARPSGSIWKGTRTVCTKLELGRPARILRLGVAAARRGIST